jgi:hypothetical protein
MHIEEADIAQEAGTATEAIVILEPSNTAEATVASISPANSNTTVIPVSPADLGKTVARLRQGIPDTSPHPSANPFQHMIKIRCITGLIYFFAKNGHDTRARKGSLAASGRKQDSHQWITRRLQSIMKYKAIL